MLLVRNCCRNASKLHTLAAPIYPSEGPPLRSHSVKLKLLQPISSKWPQKKLFPANFPDSLLSVQWSKTQLKHFGQNRRSALKDRFMRLRYRMNNYFVFFGTVKVEDWLAVALFVITGILMVLGVYMEFNALHGAHDVDRTTPKDT